MAAPRRPVGAVLRDRPLVELQVFLRHPPDAEAGLELGPASKAVDIPHACNRLDGLVDAIDDETVTPGVTTSSTDPARQATTGVP
jgi:hypothetical protein